MKKMRYDDEMKSNTTILKVSGIKGQLSPLSGVGPVNAPIIGINSDKFNLSGPNYIDPNPNTSKEFKPKPGILNSDSLVIKRDLSFKLTGADSCLSHTCRNSSTGAYSGSKVSCQNDDGQTVKTDGMPQRDSVSGATEICGRAGPLNDESPLSGRSYWG